ncbi:hypothetical protein TL16_g08704 [Triparma laevis f. inornata]|uniref:C2 domain-containing protein n=1 Tax=Triparma laevis f. inornata TaxID=1714386 RepID=A0A9W7B2B7_9STRA|nr:hypothetical protein TL16_g08704 [Triparma laevis f. inornata]
MSDPPVSELNIDTIGSPNHGAIPAPTSLTMYDGEYDCWVTIHCIKDVKNKVGDLDIDPVVFVEFMGEKFNTTVVSDGSDHIYEKTFMSKAEFTPETFERFEIKINIIDANPFGDAYDAKRGDESVGIYSLDVARIYPKSKGFERKWVGLVGEGEGKEVRGWLKLSVAIAGPGQHMLSSFNGTAAQIEEEERAEALDIYTEPYIPITVTKEVKYLVTSLYEVSELCVSVGQIHVEVEVGEKKMSSQTHSLTSDSVNFNSEVWLPISYPSLCRFLKIFIWQSKPVIGGGLQKEILATFKVELEEAKYKNGAYFANLYGAHVDDASSWNQASRAEAAKDAEYNYNVFPNLSKAPNFRGRLLLKHRIEDDFPQEMVDNLQKKSLMDSIGQQTSMSQSSLDGLSRKPSLSALPKGAQLTRKRRNSKPIDGDTTHYYGRAFRRHVTQFLGDGPEETQCEIVCEVIRGTEMPTFHNSNTPRSKIVISLSCGSFGTSTAPADNVNGVCEFYSLLSLQCKLPVDISVCPDVIISACSVSSDNKNTTPFSYERFPFSALFDSESNQFKEVDWLTLLEDKARDRLGAEQFPGSLMMKMAASQNSFAEKENWFEEIDKNDDVTPHTVRVHVYQGAELEGDVGRPSYVNVNFNGENSKKSQVSTATNFPLWYETIEFESDLPSPVYFPQVNVQVYQQDTVAGGTYMDKDFHDYIGCVNIKLTDKHIRISDQNPNLKLNPTKDDWHFLGVETPGDVGGKLLVLVEVIPKSKTGAPLPHIPDLHPEMETKLLEAIIISCANLDVVPPLDYPSVGLKMANGSEEESTKGSRRPSKSDPDYLERKVLRVDVPKNDLFMDSFPLVARLYDNKSGNRKRVYGECLIRLDGNFGFKARGTLANPHGQRDSELNQEALERLQSETPRLNIGNTVTNETQHIDVEIGTDHRFQLGRNILGDPLEKHIEKPFVDFAFGREGKKIGYMKAKIGEELGFLKDPTQNLPSIDTKTLLERGATNPRRYTVRCYVLQAWGLVPMSQDEQTGRPKRPNPYFQIKCGATTLNDRENAQHNVDSFEAYKCFELTTTIPSVKGGTQLEISVMSKNSHSADDVVGTTKIDLLNRYYSPTWNELGMCNRVPKRGEEDKSGQAIYDDIEKVVQNASKMKSPSGEEVEEMMGGPGMRDMFGDFTRCQECNAKWNEDLSQFQCYCHSIKYIRGVHQRLQTKPGESRPITIPTSRLPRGEVRLWVDILPVSEAKIFPVAYYLPDNHIKNLFKMSESKLNRHKKYNDQSIIDAIEGLDVINRLSTFFGTQKGNSVIRQCVQFKKYDLLKYFLRKHPLAAFTRHDPDDEGDDQEFVDSGSESSDSDSENEFGEEEDEDDEKEMEDDHEGGEEQGGLFFDGGEEDDGNDEMKNSGRHKITTVDAFDFAIHEQDFQAVLIMLETVAEPLVRDFKYIPEHFTRYVREMLAADYQDLVCEALRFLPLAVNSPGEGDYKGVEGDGKFEGGGKIRVVTSACDLGSLSFLNELLDKVDTRVFDSETMALVVEEMWNKFIYKRFQFEFCLFLLFVLLWCVQCESYASKDSAGNSGYQDYDSVQGGLLALTIFSINTYFCLKEVRQAKLQAEQRHSKKAEAKAINDLAAAPAGMMMNMMAGGAAVAPEEEVEGDNAAKKKKKKKKFRRMRSMKNAMKNTIFSSKVPFSVLVKSYFSDPVNVFDFLNVVFIYISVVCLKFPVFTPKVEVIFCCFATFTLTFKSTSYLRGFGETGWLVKVLYQNAYDMLPFMLIMFMLTAGFSVIFRVSLHELKVGDCGVETVGEDDAMPEEWSCQAAPYSSLHRSYANVFHMAILGDFDTGLFDDVTHTEISYFMFYMMMIYIFVVCLNALIALLGESYGDIQANANANIRKERANLIVEHLLVMPEKERQRIELESRNLDKYVDKKDWLLGNGRIFETDKEEATEAIEQLRGEVTELKGLLERVLNNQSLGLHSLKDQAV